MHNYWRTNWKKIIIGLILVVGVGFALYLSSIDTLPQGGFSLLDPVTEPVSTDRVLVLAPHQDDEVLGAGDYIIRAVNNGAQVRVVFATDGNKHGKKEIRHQEAVAADKVLGLDDSQLDFFDFPDGELAVASQYDQFTARLGSEIKSFQPTVVITTLLQEEHPDHVACGRAVKDLATTNTFKPFYFLIHSDRFPRPIGDSPTSYLLPPLKLINEYSWKVIVPTASEQAQKRQAINSYRSQLSLTNPVLRQLLQSFDRRNELFAQPIL